MAVLEVEVARFLVEVAVMKVAAEVPGNTPGIDEGGHTEVP